LDIVDRLLRRASNLAAKEGKSLTRIIEEALRERLYPKPPGWKKVT
jgi:hypothetical protein